MNRFAFLLTAALTVVPCISHAQYWQQLPGPTGGPLHWMVESADGSILASQVNGAMYRSTDNGVTWSRTWQPTQDPLPSRRTSLDWTQNGVHACVVLPNDWLMAPFRLMNGYVDMYYSDDHGQHWQLMPPTFPVQDFALLGMSVSAHGTVLVNAYKAGYYSDDLGSAWRKVKHDFREIGHPILEMRPDSWFYADGNGVFRSTDRGNTWGRCPEPPFALTKDAIIDVADDSLLFCYPGQGALNYVSSDDGRTWQESRDLLFALGDIHRLDSERLLGRTTNRLSFSRDAGLTWTQFGSENYMSSFTGLLTRGSEIYLSMVRDSEILRTDDDGETWEHRSAGMYRPRISDIAFDSDGCMFVTSHAGGVYNSTDNGLTWSMNGGSCEATNLYDRLFVTRAQTVFAIWSGFTTRRSSDHGDYWRDPNYSITSVIETDAGIFAAFNRRGIPKYLLTSIDEGESWDSVSVLPKAPDGTESAGKMQLAVVKADGRDVFLGGFNHGLCRSTDEGKHWTPIPLNGAFPVVLELHAVGADRVFALTAAELWRSKDAGVSWDRVYHDPDSGLGLGITSNSRGDLFIGDHDVIMQSKDGGERWFALPALPDGAMIRTLECDDAGVLYVGTTWHGILRSAGTTLDAQPAPVLPEQLRITGIHPHPLHADGSMHVRFEGGRDGAIRLRLFDIMGRLRRDAEIPATASGIQGYDLPLRGLRSGTYLLQLTAAGHSASRIVVIY